MTVYGFVETITQAISGESILELSQVSFLNELYETVYLPDRLLVQCRKSQLAKHVSFYQSQFICVTTWTEPNREELLGKHQLTANYIETIELDVQNEERRRRD